MYLEYLRISWFFIINDGSYFGLVDINDYELVVLRTLTLWVRHCDFELVWLFRYCVLKSVWLFRYCVLMSVMLLFGITQIGVFGLGILWFMIVRIGVSRQVLPSFGITNIGVIVLRNLLLRLSPSLFIMWNVSLTNYLFSNF